jgi:predicted HTH domain antitoxin
MSICIQSQRHTKRAAADNDSQSNMDENAKIGYDQYLDGGVMERKLTIEYGEEILLGLGLSPEQFSEEAKFLLAAKLYELGKVTSGQAAKLCGMERVEFLFSLERAGVTMSNLRPEDADVELGFAKNG